MTYCAQSHFSPIMPGILYTGMIAPLESICWVPTSYACTRLGAVFER